MTLRTKRIWDVADFAAHAGDGFEGEAGRRRARRLLKRLDDKHQGKLLIPSKGTNREYTFFVAVLARLEPDLFTPVQSLEFRVEALEEHVDNVAIDQRRIASHVGALTRDLVKLRSRHRAA